MSTSLTPRPGDMQRLAKLSMASEFREGVAVRTLLLGGYRAGLWSHPLGLSWAPPRSPSPRITLGQQGLPWDWNPSLSPRPSVACVSCVGPVASLWSLGLGPQAQLPWDLLQVLRCVAGSRENWLCCFLTVSLAHAVGELVRTVELILM